jgi:hypothetical protein
MVSVHIYVVIDFQCFPMLCVLERIDDGATSNNLKKVIMANVQAVSSLTRDELATQMVCFRAGNDTSHHLYCMLFTLHVKYVVYF